MNVETLKQPGGGPRVWRGWRRTILYARAYRRWLGVAISILIAVQVVVIQQRLTSTRAVSRDEVLSEFRLRQSQLDAARSTDQTQAPVGTEEQPVQGTEPPVAGGAPGRSQPGVAATGQPPAGPCTDSCFPTIAPPDPGVYEYYQCAKTSGQCTGGSEPLGWEEIGGVRRSFDRIGQRYVTVSSASDWNNVHFYAKEHREEFDLHIDRTGVYNSRYKVDISFGPVGSGSDIRMEPPLMINRFPMKVGDAWSGSWHDANRTADADYHVKIAGKENITVDGRVHPTWVIEQNITLKGPKNTGVVKLKFWLSMDVRTPVQEVYDEQMQTPEGSYRSYWMTTLISAKPSTS